MGEENLQLCGPYYHHHAIIYAVFGLCTRVSRNGIHDLFVLIVTTS